MSLTPLQAAKHACELSDWKITNLQLQKILYIASMIYAGRSGHPKLIFDNDFEAWNYGPVHPVVYKYVSVFGSKPIKNIFHSIDDFDKNSSESKMIINAVKKLSNIPAFKLVEIVHDNKSAWSKHYIPGIKGITIPHEDVVAEYNARFHSK
jgi:uncharacterized phage-associated protein